ncbi:hypothetical protein D3C84_1305880 [compost metagenome]
MTVRFREQARSHIYRVLQRHRVMQRVTFYALVGTGDPGIGIVRGANSDFMPASKAQADT